jgi:hypothetical protein
MHTKFWSENVKGKDHSEDVGADRRIILKWILEKYDKEVVDWAHLAQDKTSGGLL